MEILYIYFFPLGIVAYLAKEIGFVIVALVYIPTFMKGL